MSAIFNRRKILHFFLLASAVTILIIGALFFANYVSNNTGAQAIVYKFGYIGVFVVSFISGVNVIIPIPPATFVPIFTAAGLLLPLIVTALVLGTLFADLAGYIIGILSKKFVAYHYPKTNHFFKELKNKHEKLLLPFVFFYTAFIPLPNEAFIIPLAMMGVRIRNFIIPLILGTTFYHLLTIYGAQTIFAYFF
jgi:membrane protein YqaA with SNARE-associated domain